jgi:hypothetical protein
MGEGQSWYVPSGEPANRFVPKAGAMPPLHLVDYQHSLRLCEDSTGLLVGPTDRRLAAAGLYVTNLRGESYYAAANRAADTRPRQPLKLVREPDNPHDRFAIAVHAGGSDSLVGYVNKQKARAWSKFLDDGVVIRAISIRGTDSGVPCDAVAVLAARPEVVTHLLGPRPAILPRPAFLLG